MKVLFLKPIKNDTVSYEVGDIRSVVPYGYSGEGSLWVLDNTDKGYRRVLPLSGGCSEDFIVANNDLTLFRVKEALLPELLTESERTFLHPELETEQSISSNALPLVP